MSSSFSSAGSFFPLGEPVVPRSDSRMCKVGSENRSANGCFRADARKSKAREPTGVDPHQYKANRLFYTLSCLT